MSQNSDRQPGRGGDHDRDRDRDRDRDGDRDRRDGAARRGANAGSGGGQRGGGQRGGGQRGGGQRGGDERPPSRDFVLGEAWNAVGTLGAGIAFWGLVGWGIDRLTGLHHVFLPIGIVLGLAAALYLVIYQALHR